MTIIASVATASCLAELSWTIPISGGLILLLSLLLWAVLLSLLGPTLAFGAGVVGNDVGGKGGRGDYISYLRVYYVRFVANLSSSTTIYSHISIAFIRELQTLFSLSVAVTLLVAIELSIQWNGISSSVDQVSTSAQLIPLLATIAVILIGILHSLTTTDDYGGGSSPSAYGSSHSGSSRVSRSEKNSSSSSGGSGPVAGRDGEVVVDWGDGNTGQSFVPPPPARPGDGFPVPPPPSPPGPAQPIPVYPPGVRTVMIEPPEDHATTSRSNSPGNSHTEASGTGESAQYENDKTSRSSEGEEDDDKDTDNNYTSDPLSPSDRGEGGAGGFGFPPPISIPLAAGPPRQKFPPPKWPPGWGQHETQRHTSPPPMGGHGFPPPPMPAFMLPFPGVVRPPPPF